MTIDIFFNDFSARNLGQSPFGVPGVATFAVLRNSPSLIVRQSFSAMMGQRIWTGTVFAVGIGDVEMRVAEVTLHGQNLRQVIVLPRRGPSPVSRRSQAIAVVILK